MKGEPEMYDYTSNNTGQQRFWSMRKNVCSWSIFGRWIRICFQNFSITHIIRSRLKGWNFCTRTLRCFFTMDAMMNSRISSPRKMVQCFAIMFVPLWKFLAMNLTQISGDCSLIRQKWAWMWFYSTTEINSPPFLWLMQPTWREVKKAWSYCWERLNMTNLTGSYVLISRLWHCYWECNLGTKQYCCFLCEWNSRDKKNHFVNKLCPKRTSLTSGEKNVVNPPLVLPEKIFLPPLHTKLGLMKSFVKGMYKTGRGFEYLRNKFPNLSDAKI